MTMSDRGVHPDLLEEESAPLVPEAAAPPARGRRSRTAPASAPAAEPTPAAQESEPVDASLQSTGDAQAAAEPPEWWQQVKDASDPMTAVSTLLKNVPITELEKNDTIRGWIGDMGNRRARALLQQQQTEEIARQKREALAQNDFYGLGQLTAPEIRQQFEQNAAAQNFAPFMDAVATYQSRFPTEVQQQVQGKTYGAGKTQQEGFVEYLEALTEAAVGHRLTDAVEKEIRRREPALRKAWLSQSNGAQPVPELDGGPAHSSREITDEQIDRMSLEEFDTYFDDRGKPRPGVRVRLTRGVDTTRQR